MKKILSLAAITFSLLLMLAPVASATEFISQSDDKGNVTLSSTETHHNAYVGGASVFINSATTGDLYAVGQSLVVEGPTELDLVVAGGTVTVNGPVGGDVRIVAGTVILNSKVGGDLVVAGGTVTLTEKGSIGGDAFVAGGTVVFDGPVAKNLKVKAGHVTVNNNIYGDVNISASEALVFGSKAVVSTKVSYKGPKEAVLQDGAQISPIDYQQTRDRNHEGAGEVLASILTIIVLVKIIGIILLGLVLLNLLPRTTQNLVQSVPQKPWLNLGLGILGLIVIPIVSILLMITVFGIYIGIILLLAMIVLMIISLVVACIFVGSWVLKMINKSDATASYKTDWKALALGATILTIVSAIPLIGILIFLIVMLIAFGAVMRHAYGHVTSERESVTDMPSATIE